MIKEEKNKKPLQVEEAKILVVEDSPTQLTNLQYTLENEGYKVITAENGKEAIEKLDDFYPDVVISDILMPEMDGYELCKTIKKERKWQNIPIILLTALTDPQDVIKGLNVGADNFIPKPFSDEFLLSRIKHLLVNNRMRSGAISNMGIEIFFAGNRHLITSERMQIIDLLLSTYENAVNKNNELLRANLELNKLKEDLEKKNAELENINEEKNHFIGMAAHDIRNPLGSIYNFANLLHDELKENLSQSKLDFIEIIKSSADMLLNMVTELLDISKIEAGKLVLKKTANNLVDFIKRNIGKNTYLAEKKGISIQLKYDFDEALLEYDASRLDQVLNNLLSNAIKYSEPNSKITVKLELKNDKIIVSIRDQGVGIPLKEQKKLFKPFSKTSAKATAGESSTGLGLFTCKKIIEAHEGEIGVESEKGEGATFYFTLPITKDKPEVEVKKEEIDEKYDQLANKKILLVDDIEMNYSYFKGAVSKLPVKLEWASDGDVAIDLCKKNKYDLVLMDIHLPGLSGLEVTRRIRQFNKDVIIIGQTAYAMDGMEEKCINAGCNDYMAMPIRPKQVIEAIKKNIK